MPMTTVSMKPVNPGPVIFSFYAIGLAFVFMGWLNGSAGQAGFGLMILGGVYYTSAWIRAKRKDAEARLRGKTVFH
jgi:hypothetical protein